MNRSSPCTSAQHPPAKGGDRIASQGCTSERHLGSGSMSSHEMNRPCLVCDHADWSPKKGNVHTLQVDRLKRLTRHAAVVDGHCRVLHTLESKSPVYLAVPGRTVVVLGCRVIPTVSLVRAAVPGEPAGLVGARMEWWLGGGVPFGLSVENPRGLFLECFGL